MCTLLTYVNVVVPTKSYQQQNFEISSILHIPFDLLKAGEHSSGWITSLERVEEQVHAHPLRFKVHHIAQYGGENHTLCLVG